MGSGKRTDVSHHAPKRMISKDENKPSNNGERLSVKVLKSFCLAVSRVVWAIEYEGLENIPNHSGGGVVIASNHQTYIDPVWIGIPIKRDLRFLAWDAAFKWPVIGPLVRWLGSLPVNTATGRNPDSLRKAVEFLESGSGLMVFPEGAREFEDGIPLDFKPGAVALAAEARVPILPVTISGGNRVWPREWRWPKRGKVTVRFHPLLEIPEISHENRKSELHELTKVLRSTIVGRPGGA